MSPAAVVLLDLDGTLTDSAPGILNCVRYALDAMAIEHPDDAVMRKFLGPPLAASFREHMDMSDADIARAIDAYRERFHDVGLFENAVYPGVPEMLAALDDAGLVIALATSKPTVSATRIVEHYGLAPHIDFVGGSDLAGTRHDKAAVIAHTLEELSIRGLLREPILMVGDREHDVIGARAHGIDTIGVLWGYGDADELLSAGAVALAEAPAALPTLVRDGTARPGSSGPAGPRRP